jgi:hypothetical protein
MMKHLGWKKLEGRECCSIEKAREAKASHYIGYVSILKLNVTKNLLQGLHQNQIGGSWSTKLWS